ncbi:MAG TPA: DegT/DnrJ/EryC1/StrS family aminotransferase [Spirochaetia bacterium]|nr:DegT/DnrJ/EryC1/StrS family aminotransferase [Spirochaetia bacterium]
MKVGFYGHVRQYHAIKSEIDTRLQEVLESGEYVMGPMLKRFEKELCDYTGLKYAVGVNSGTDAIWLSLLALGIGPGDECITTANTFFATAEAVWFTGATVVFVDSDPRTNCIDPNLIEKAITRKTRAIIPVHLYGQCADMKAIRAIADRHSLRVIEDNAQGFGARGNGFRIGELGDAVCTSFIIQKNLGTFGDGGAVVTNNPEIDRIARKLRNHGSDKRSVHSMGYNSRLDDIHAGFLSVKLKHIDAWNAQRRTWSERMTRGLSGARTFTLPYAAPGYYHIYHLYVIETKKPEHRDQLLKFLNDNGIDAKCHYPIAIHQQEGYPWGKQARIVGPLTQSERNAATCVSLPMYPEMTAEEVDFVAAKTMEWDAAHA